MSHTSTLSPNHIKHSVAAEIHDSILCACRYERVEAQARNQGRRQRAQLLVDFEQLVSQDEIDDPTIFPEW